jgi:hypothetical protein
MKLRGFAASYAALALITFGASGCSEAGASNEPPTTDTAVTVESAGEDEPARLTVSERGVERLGLRTEPVRAVSGQRGVTEAVSYSAIIYDADGKSWAYSSPSPRTYIRVPLEINSITGKTVLLKSGPPVGTQVVVVGAPELVGAEAGISGEE